MKTDYKVIYYFQDEKQCVYLNDKNDKIRYMDMKNINKSSNKFHCFRTLKGYNNTHEDLIKFKNDFIKDCDDIKKVKLLTKGSKKYFSIDYTKYYKHKDAVYFNWVSYEQSKFLESVCQPITRYEFFTIEKCNNGALITLNLDYKLKPPSNCYSYDYSSYYSNLLVNMSFPINEGKFYTLDNVEFGKLKYGIYRVDINYTNDKFTNVFRYSHDKHYTSTTLNSIYQYKDFFGLELKLLEKDEDYNYNALIYEYSDLRHGREFFSHWLADLKIIKNQLPKNKLVKHLMSTLVGSLTSFKNVYLNDIEDEDESIIESPDDTDYKLRDKTPSGKYKCVKSDDAYNYKMARIKPFILSLGRARLFKLIMNFNLIDNVIAIHTDRITFNKKVNFDKLHDKYKSSKTEKYYPIEEAKSTGYIRFQSSTRYYHVCKKCNKDIKDYKVGCDCCK